MMLFTNMMKFLLVAVVFALTAVNGEEEGSFVYKDTKICAKHRSKLCMSFGKDSEVIALDRRHKLRWDVETVERVNMQLNRVYTYAKDKATRKTVKSCMVRREIEGFPGVFGVGLAPCDTDDRELVLALDTPPVDNLKLDEFMLKEISYLDDDSEVSSSMCLTATFNDNGVLKEVSKKDELHRRSMLILGDCDSTYAQDFRAKGFDHSSSSRFTPNVPAAQVEARIGKFCLSDQPDLCLGISLANGTTLQGDVFVQVKNYTKNEAKNLHDLKMRWYHDLENQRIATAAQLDYCLEAIYGALIGKNRAGKDQYDDIVHLGSCDASRSVRDDISEQLRQQPKSEIFYTKQVSTPTESYLELRTDVPAGLNVSGDATKCVSIVKCVKHVGDHCTKYNSVPVYEAELLQQGAYARLKDCNSEEMPSQRFYYVADEEVTMPPTHFPTPKPQTQTPTPSPTSTPTGSPTAVATEPVNPPDTGSTDDNGSVDKASGAVALKAALAFIGILCLAVLIVAIAYYYKNKNEFANPEEDENFIARV